MPATPFIDLLSAITVSLEEALCGYCRMTVDDVALFDYHGALVVVETDVDEIVFIHPPGGPAEAPASLPSNPCRPREAPADAAVRMVREMTGLQVTIVREFASFIQEGTPTGTMFAHCYVARVYDGSLIDDGPEGPARSYPLDALPAITPIRIANQRALHAYLEQLHQISGPA
jgi:ADP-ribose pyrophosphatase YjhB (NUDIX family)